MSLEWGSTGTSDNVGITQKVGDSDQMHVVGRAETHRIFSPRHSRNSTYQAEDWKTEFWEIQPGQKERTEDTDTGVHLPSRFVKFKNKNKNKKYPTYTLTFPLKLLYQLLPSPRLSLA